MAHKQSTAQPPKRLEINAWFRYVAKENQKLAKKRKN